MRWETMEILGYDKLNFTQQTDIDAIELDNICNLKEQIA